jgi:hypothetical protein
LWTFGIVSGNVVYFSLFGILQQEKSGNPDGRAKTPRAAGPGWPKLGHFLSEKHFYVLKKTR